MKPTTAPISGRITHPVSFIDKWEGVVKNTIHEKGLFRNQSLENFNITVNNKYKYILENIDKWSTPEEFLDNNGGDCEDFAIYKFFSLALPKYIAVGSLLDGRAHAVCVVYSAEHEEWMTLDILTNDLIMWKEYILSFTPLYLCDLDGVYV